MSNDYNQIILERFFEEALEEGLTDAEASKQAYARFWDVELKCLECSGEGTLCTGHPNDPSGGSYGCPYCNHSGIEEVSFKEEEYEDLEHLKEDYGSRLVKAELIPGTKAP